MFNIFKKHTVKLSLKELLNKAYEQQQFLADTDTSFIRVLPIKECYTRESVKEAIYYAQCADIEIYEYQLAKPSEKLDEAVDIAIFTLNILAYLGCTLSQCKTISIQPIKNTKQVLIQFHRLLSTVLYSHIDYKQWKFPEQESVKLSIQVENLLIQLARIGFGLSVYEAIKISSKYIKPETVLLNAIKHKMQVTRRRAILQVSKQLMKA